MKEIFEMLKLSPFYNESETIEIAKGKYKRIRTVKEAIEKAKRDVRWKRK